jgi:hypothetical protein
MLDDWGEIESQAVDAERPESRVSLFEDAISLVHRLAPNYSLYIGRTYYRAGDQGAGLRNRWKIHQQNRGMSYAKCLARVPRNRVVDDETLAIALVKCWADYDALCCNNDVVASPGRMSDDRFQLLYVCLRKRPLR